MTERELHRLLVRAGIASTAYFRALWFTGCRFEHNRIVCPDLATAERLDRMFGERLRAVAPGLEFQTDIGLRAADMPAPTQLRKV